MHERNKAGGVYCSPCPCKGVNGEHPEFITENRKEHRDELQRGVSPPPPTPAPKVIHVPRATGEGLGSYSPATTQLPAPPWTTPKSKLGSVLWFRQNLPWITEIFQANADFKIKKKLNGRIWVWELIKKQWDFLYCINYKQFGGKRGCFFPVTKSSGKLHGSFLPLFWSDLDRWCSIQ